jgi:hypothetical protein
MMFSAFCDGFTFFPVHFVGKDEHIDAEMRAKGVRRIRTP